MTATNYCNETEQAIISAFYKGLKPSLLKFVQANYPVAQSIVQACQQVADACQLLYCDTFEACHEHCADRSADMMVASDSSTDSEAVAFSDFFSDEEVEDDESDESCVESDFVESQEESDEDDEEVYEVPSFVVCDKKRFKCYGCHGTGHVFKNCPIKDITC
jgi:hypothetical protein